jgi:group I intron endonuclease
MSHDTQQKYSGFIYIWFDSESKKYYIGSHKGTVEDGYTGSGLLFKKAYSKRPEKFKRRILEYVLEKENIIERENYWLSMINPNDLGKKYYNLKKVAAGGDIVSTLSPEARQQHAEKSSTASKKYWSSITEEERETRRKTCFGGNKFDRSYMTEKNRKNKKFGKDNHFYGKTHSQENIEKTRKLHSGNKYRLGSILSEESKRKISENNANRKSINTPFGIFASSDEFAEKIGSCIGHIMRNKLDCKITKRQVERSKLFQEHHIGKTPRELGYSYAN